jgi:ABC-type multidrug transport system ATPase subunit
LDAVVTERIDCWYRRFPWSRGRAALRDVSLRVARGELHLLAGANGAGKSTLLKILAGVARPSGGSVRVLDHEPGARALLGRFAWLPEASESESRVAARASIEYWAALYGFRGSERRDRAARVLDEVGLAPLAERSLRSLSKGERRRVAVAQALVSDAELYLLDEPLDGVDPESSELLIGVFAARCRAGSTVLLSSHVLLDGRRGGDVLTVLDAGRVVASGPPDRLLERDERGAALSFAELLRRRRAAGSGA